MSVFPEAPHADFDRDEEGEAKLRRKFNALRPRLFNPDTKADAELEKREADAKAGWPSDW
jgi:hypothetical protein